MLNKKFLKEFANPSSEWRLAPFWFLNHRLEDAELIHQIHEMHDAGLGGFVLHARHGLLTPYMSDEWMRRMETCCAEARKLDMWAWLYDENNWPSGTCNARVIVEHPEYRMSQLYISWSKVVQGPDRLAVELPGQDELALALLVPTDETGSLRVDRKTRVRDLTGKIRDGVLKAPIPVGRWTLMVFSRSYPNFAFANGYTDLLNKEACRLFMRYTHDAYAHRLKRYYGRTIKGIFTDEPSSCYAQRSDSVHWTPRLPKEFARDHRYPLATALPALFFNVGPETASFRCDFARTVLRLYVEAFFGPIYDHCQRRGLLSIGHVNCEGEVRYTMKEQLDYFALTRRMHYAGIDTLTSVTWVEEGRPQNLVGIKLASSAGHLLEKPRVMDEAWALASAWKVDLEELKLLGDWHIALGANYFIPHAFYYSLEGVRKWECPPDEFYHEPYWPWYKLFADRLARLSMIFTGSTHVAPVAVLYPARTGWTTMIGLDKTDGEADILGNKVAKTLYALSEELLRARLDFDYISEEILQDAELSGGHIVARGKGRKHLEEFQVLVLPEIAVLDRDTLRAIDEYVNGGGRLYVVGNRPSAFSDTGVDPAIPRWLTGLAQAHPGRVLFFDSVSDELITHVGDSVFRHVHIRSNRDVVVLHHRRKEGAFFFLLNTSREHTFTDVPVAFATVGIPQLFNPDTGAVHPLTGFRHQDGQTLLHMDFAPRQSYAIFLGPPDARVLSAHEVLPDSKAPLGIARPVPDLASVASSRSVERDERLRILTRNARTLLDLASSWEFTAAKGNYLPLTRFTEQHRGGGRMPGDEWMQASLTYQTSFRVNARPSWCRLIVDGLMRQERYEGRMLVPVTIKLNGVELSAFEASDHYDRLCHETDVTQLLRQGDNHLEISSDCGGMGPNAHVTQPLVLVGDFTVTSTDSGEAVDAPRRSLEKGDWAAQGYPYFSGQGLFKRTIDVPGFSGRAFICFEQLAEAVEVVLNGTSVGVILWPPYQLELTGHLKQGVNELELRVANTNHNLFLREPLPSGLIGRVSIVEVLS